MSCVGRFAPSPTGPLHLGSLLCAVISYLDSKSQQGLWRLRIDDLDTPRVSDAHTHAILSALEAHGFVWDGALVYQSQQTLAYQEAFDQLLNSGMVFPCGLSRRALRERFSGVHPGRLQAEPVQLDQDNNWRFDTALASDCYLDDRILGKTLIKAGDIECFTLKRKEGLFAYHLACVVDDEAMGITQVTRGNDLFSSTPEQCLLQDALGFARPEYAHHLVLIDDRGDKLSKQTFAQALDVSKVMDNLHYVLRVLGYQQFPETAKANELLDWAVSEWHIDRIRGRDQVLCER